MRGKGNITARGKSSWRIKFDIGRDPVTGKRRYRLETFRGSKQDAQRELRRLLVEHDRGTLVDHSTLTVAEYFRHWMGNDHSLSPKTLERYCQLVEQQIIPHLGNTLLQKLKPSQVRDWHSALLHAGGKDGRPLSARTVGHAHRVLHRGLERAVEAETLARNAAHAISPPKVEAVEVEALTAGQMAALLSTLEGHTLHPIAALALGSGMRRGELLAVRWQDVDLAAETIRVERALEETKGGLRFKPPKTRHGRRTISIPESTVEILKAHRTRQLETRLLLGMGKHEPEALVFSEPDGSPKSPDNLSRDWRMAVKALKLPEVMFHALRHSHASALIASGLDVLTISRRLGHGSPVVTLTTYAHLFARTDTAAAKAIEAALKATPDR